jgi:hypothetical protein
MNGLLPLVAGGAHQALFVLCWILRCGSRAARGRIARHLRDLQRRMEDAAHRRHQPGSESWLTLSLDGATVEVESLFCYT